MKMLIGSNAARYWFSDFPREPKDKDYICREKINGEDNHFCASFQYILNNFKGEIAPPEVLYTLKVSHSFWDIKWAKTMYDIYFFQNKGLKINEPLYELLYKDWAVIHGKKRANLMKSNEEFFKDKVNRRFAHDNIHRAIAFYDEPMFDKIKEDKGRAMTSKAMFFNLSHDDQIKTVQEEIFVTALERFLIPSDFRMCQAEAYFKGIKKLITTMSKGWFPRFIVDNWANLCHNPKIDFIAKFKQNIKNYERDPSH